VPHHGSRERHRNGHQVRSDTGGIVTTELLVGVLSGLFALAGSLTTLFLQGRQQRAMARDERLWSRRAETYVALLQYQGGGMVEGYRGARTAKEWAVRDELAAKAAAFASDVVRELWQQSASASLNLSDHVSEEWPEWGVAPGDEQDEIEDEMEEDQAFCRLRQASADAGGRLAEQIRAEMDTDRCGRCSRLSRRGGRSALLTIGRRGATSVRERLPSRTP
jgi:hypothetical protein